MRVISARDAARSFGALLTGVRERGPVTVVRHRRAVAVVMDPTLYKEYRDAYESVRKFHVMGPPPQGVSHLEEGRLGGERRAPSLAARRRDGRETERAR